MKIETRSRIIVFILAFLTWAALTNLWDAQEVIAGLITAAIVSLIAGKFLITAEKSRHIFTRFLFLIKYLFTFLWELMKANLNVAYIVVHPKLPIKPGIVKVKTNLCKDSARTLLTNSITLTPGTMSVDINPQSNEIYIHWIKVKSKDPKDVMENTRNISYVFEKVLTEVFE